MKYLICVVWLPLLLISCKQDREKTNDYALYSNSGEWSQDWAMGGPSWDTFERFPGNPVYKGHKGMEWPVNGFLFSDPVSGNWYLYIGEYRTNYAPATEAVPKRTNCVILRSSDQGRSWQKTGDLFPDNMIVYDSLKIQAPDVMVTYAEGKYHMVFDWVAGNAVGMNPKSLSGLGYAEADKPEGPWIVSGTPLKVNNRSKLLLNRYARMYGPMIVKRKHDWVLLYSMDTAPHGRSWALAASASARPEGPYGDTKILLHVESKAYYPPYIEYYPAFIHDDYVYFPGTSLISHDYQYVSRVKTEDILDPGKYEVFAAGGIWHSADAENEYHGLFGQTFTGFIDDDNDSVYVMFPSRNKDNYGTINLAKASWDHLYRKRGFNFSAAGRKAFSFIKKGIDVKSFDIAFKLDGTMHLIWDLHGAIDIYTGLGIFSDGNKFSLDQNNAVYKEIVINKASWKIGLHDNNRGSRIIDSGSISHWNNTTNRLKLKKDNGKYSLVINDVKCWEGQLKNDSGLAGIALDRHSYLHADRFVVSGEKVPGYITYGFYRSLVAAGNQDSVWTFKKDDTLFLYGKGAVSKDDSNFVKWNFYGKSFSLYSPKGPLFGTVNIYLDGKLLKKVSLKNAKPTKSAIVFQSDDISPGKHAVYVESFDGLLPVDCIRVEL